MDSMHAFEDSKNNAVRKEEEPVAHQADSRKSSIYEGVPGE